MLPKVESLVTGTGGSPTEDALFKGGAISVAPLVQQTRTRPDFVSWEP